MEIFDFALFDFIFHIDKYLAIIIAFLGNWIYVLLFAIVFVETGLVVAPFLPGDSLLFATGALAGADMLNVWVAYFVLLFATILGDTVNYWIGRYVGPKVFCRPKSRFFKKEHLEKTHRFYEKHGGKTIIIARFIPIMRTFAPFVAGVGRMRYGNFLFYNVLGAFIWVTVLLFLGFNFGGLPFVKANFEYVILAIIAISFSPMIIKYIKHKRQIKKESGA